MFERVGPVEKSGDGYAVAVEVLRFAGHLAEYRQATWFSSVRPFRIGRLNKEYLKGYDEMALCNEERAEIPTRSSTSCWARLRACWQARCGCKGPDRAVEDIMELNGVAEMVVKLDRLEDEEKVSPAVARELRRDLEVLDRYLTAYHYLKQIGWHEVRAMPHYFPTNAEMQQRLFKAVKAAESSPKLSAEAAAVFEIQAAYPGRKTR